MRSFLLLVCSATLASAQIAPPQVGWILDSNRSIRPVLGVSGNLVVGDAIGEAVTASTSARWALDSTGQPALLWSGEESTLLRWTGARFEPIALTDGAVVGSVVSLAQTGDRIRFAVTRDDGIWLLDISAADGTLVSQTALPGICAPVLLQSTGSLIYIDQTALVIRNMDGTERRVEVGIKVADLAPLGADWVLASEQAVDEGTIRKYAVRIQPGREQVSQLPEIRLPEIR